MLISHFNKYVIASFMTAVSLLLLGSTANAASITGGTTTVNLTASTVTALTGLGFTIAPVSPGTLTGLVASFPITGGDTTTMINHSGGLAFTDNNATADIENFVINPVTGRLTGDLIAGGTTTHNFIFFDIGAGASLTLDGSLAGALSSVYGIPNLTGASIGTATISEATSPEPASVGLAGLGVVALTFAVRKKKQ